jgi:homoserine kinase
MGSSEVSVFAPATVANLGPGFDILGLALQGCGDIVTASRAPTPGVHIIAIDGDGGLLPHDPLRNTAAVAATHVLRRAGMADVGVGLSLHKGMPLGSGLGSSAASAAAAAMAVNLLLGSPLRKQALIEPCVEAEAAVSGRHADNVAPALLGGLVLIRSLDPLDVVRLPVPEGVTAVVVTPDMALPTREARAALPPQVPLRDLIHSTAQVAALVSACYANDLGLLSRALDERVVTTARLPLIPGGAQAIAAAKDAGALGASISGAGPSIFALCRSERSAAEVAVAMQRAFRAAGLGSRAISSPADAPGARRL